jgi:predicted nucleotidyltransferase
MNVTAEILVHKVKNSLLSIDKDAEVILFGSRARGDARADSDWDFLFLTSLPVTNSLRHEVVEKMLDVELEENLVLQVIPKNKTIWETKYVDSPFYLNVKDDGIRI